MSDLGARGISRDQGNEFALVLFFHRRPSDEDMREVLSRVGDDADGRVSILRVDYERLLASIPQGPRVVR